MSHMHKLGRSDYFAWLISLVDSPNQDLSRNYRSILSVMDQIPYIYVYQKDLDREIDAYEFRDRWIFSCCEGPVRSASDAFSGPFRGPSRACMDDIFNGKPVSFLEFLVSMCVNYSERVLVYPGEPSVAPEIFYDIMGNLDFLACNDENFDRFGPNFVEEKCKNVLNHVKNHVIFHVKNSEKLDFWTILGVYAREKFEF